MLFIFDCDGTLVDSEYLNNRALSEILSEEGVADYSPEKCIDLFHGLDMESCIQKVEALEQVKTPLDAKSLIEKYQKRTLQNMSRDLRTNPKTIDYLTQLQDLGCTMVVASNGEHRIVLETLRAAGLYDIFGYDRIFTKNMVAHPKPAPDLFLFAARKSGGYTDTCVVIEDTVTGVRAARAATMRVIGTTEFHVDKPSAARELKMAGADYIVEDLSQLLLEKEFSDRVVKHANHK